jgi:DNA-binding MarR family transcriptional regulator/GNAT superfamily N-acetyltransferase
MNETELDAQIAAVRAFSRFYTRQLGLLEEGLLKTAFSLTEGRVLYELAQRDGLTASDLARDLGLDAGYLSRILKKFEVQGFLERAPCDADGRQSRLTLTNAGRAAFAPLDSASKQEVAGLLTPLSSGERAELVASMTTVQRLLGGAPLPYVLRPFRVGDIGWVAHRHGVLYAEEYGWDVTFEAMVAEIGARFVRNFDPKRECGWIAERAGTVIGSAFVAAESETVAKLRMVYVEPSARGLGLGRRLVEECLRFARAAGYREMTLWTFNVLAPARQLYQKLGFTLRSEQPSEEFGQRMTAENWDRLL